MNENLVTFVYILLRDYLPAGEVESIVVNHIEKLHRSTKTVGYSNEHIEKYAREIARRIEKDTRVSGR